MIRPIELWLSIEESKDEFCKEDWLNGYENLRFLDRLLLVELMRLLVRVMLDQFRNWSLQLRKIFTTDWIQEITTISSNFADYHQENSEKETGLPC